MAADRAEVVKGLRDFADWLESNEQVPVPWEIRGQHFLSIEEVRAGMHLTGPWEKRFIGSYAEYSRAFGGNVALEFNVEREQVCRKVQVGTKHIPATEARDEPVYEWQCTDLPGFSAHAQAGVEAIREASK